MLLCQYDEGIHCPLHSSFYDGIQPWGARFAEEGDGGSYSGNVEDWGLGRNCKYVLLLFSFLDFVTRRAGI